MFDFFNKFYSKLQAEWLKIFYIWPLTYLTPFSSLGTFLLIAVQMIWTFIFVYNDIGNSIEYSTTGVFAILSATLGFILPLQLSTALEKNSGCIDNFNALTGDIVAFAMDIISFTLITDQESMLSKEELKKKAIVASKIRSDIFDIIIAMPVLSKWHFRKKQDLNKVTTKGNVLFKNTEGGYQVILLLKKIPSMSPVEACFYKLLDYVKDLNQIKTQILPIVTMRSWERAYGSWGSMGSLNAYQQPLIFQYVVNSALIFYSFLLPYEFYESGYSAIWMSGSIGYFFLGLNVAGHRARNPFAHGKRLFQTVTIQQKVATKELNQMWTNRDIIFKLPHEILNKNTTNFNY
tara:strand:+ start:11273 stop:12316 length:1044 start_codon:yes stop_codon:yes gene_type:complete